MWFKKKKEEVKKESNDAHFISQLNRAIELIGDKSVDMKITAKFYDGTVVEELSRHTDRAKLKRDWYADPGYLCAPNPREIALNYERMLLDRWASENSTVTIDGVTYRGKDIRSIESEIIPCG